MGTTAGPRPCVDRTAAAGREAQAFGDEAIERLAMRRSVGVDADERGGFERRARVSGGVVEPLRHGIHDADAKRLVPLPRAVRTVGGGQPFDALDQPSPQLADGGAIAGASDEYEVFGAVAVERVRDAPVGLGEHAGESRLPRTDAASGVERRVCGVFDRLGVVRDVVFGSEPILQAMRFDEGVRARGRVGGFVRIGRGREREELADAREDGRRRHGNAARAYVDRRTDMGRPGRGALGRRTRAVWRNGETSPRVGSVDGTLSVRDDEGMGGALLAVASMMGAIAPVGAPVGAPARDTSQDVPRPESATASPRVPAPRLSPEFLPAAHDRARRARELQLSPLEEGGYRYEGDPDERFDALIRRDGVVVFELDPLVKVELDGACLLAVCVTRGMVQSTPGLDVLNLGMRVAAQVLSAWASGSTGGRAPRDRWVETMQTRSTALPQTAPSMAGVGGRFGYLPPPRAAMSAFLERTFEFRLELAKLADAERRDAQLRALPGRLVAAWMRHADAPRRRKDAILELWDELQLPVAVPDELRADVARSLQPARERAADEARLCILDFVRRHAPAGSPEAYTEAELAAINAGRVGAARFEPYGVDGVRPSAPGGGAPPPDDRARDSRTLRPRSLPD